MSTKKIIQELKEHSPFTFLATIIAILLVVIVKFSLIKEIPETLFHIIHPAHIFVSAVVSSALFYRYKKNVIQSLLVGMGLALVLGSISDVIFPWLGGLIFNLETQFHLPLIKDTFLIISTALIGSLLGIILKITKEPHFIHVFLSVFASLFYLTTFSNSLTYIEFILMVIIVFVAVLIPCCFSDIVFPVILSRNKKDSHKHSYKHKHKHNK